MPSDDHSKLLYWLMSGLLTLLLVAVGLYARALDSRLQKVESLVEAYASRESQRWETLGQTSSARWERLSITETKLAALEPRLSEQSAKLSSMEPRLPLIESKVTSADSRLMRIEEKLDVLSQRLLQARSLSR